MFFVGVVILLLGIIIYFYLKHNVIKPYYQRTSIFSNELFLNISTLTWIILLISGTILIILSNIIIGIVIVSIIILYSVLLKFVGNDYSIIKTNYEVYQKFKENYPDKDENFYLYLVAKSRYSTLPEEDLLSIISDSTDIDHLIKNILRFDRPYYQNMNTNELMTFLENYERHKNKVLRKLKIIN